MPERPKRFTRLLSTRTFVIAFAIVEAVLLAWFIASDLRARRERRAAHTQPPTTRSTLP